MGFMKDCDSADFASQVKDQLNDIHDVMFKKASDDLNSHVRFASTWPEFIQALNDGCLVQAPFCGDKDVEADIKTRSAADTGGEAQEAGAPSMGAKSLCIPFDPLVKFGTKGNKCVLPGCDKPAINNTMFGRSY